MTAYTKPLPQIDDSNRPYWQGLKERRVTFLTCTSCDRTRVYTFRKCAHCGSEQSTWKELSGTGEIWSLGRFHQVYFEGFRDEVPYTVVIVQLDDGPRVYSNIVESDPATVRIGARVEPVFDPATDDVTLLKFRVQS